MQWNTIIHDDSLNVMKSIDQDSIDLIYLDPPFYTQHEQKSVSSKTREEKNIHLVTNGWIWMNTYHICQYV